MGEDTSASISFSQSKNTQKLSTTQPTFGAADRLEHFSALLPTSVKRQPEQV